VITWLFAGLAAVASGTRADEAGKGDDACSSVWFPRGARVELESDGAMPLSRRTIQMAPVSTDAGCQADIEIRSKTALAALMGPPVITEQRQRVILRPATRTSPASVTGSATVNAWGKYARLYGTTTIDGLGLLDFQYRGADLREGAVIDGETVDASASLTIFARDSGERVGELVAPHATVSIAARHVGKRQIIQTTQGPSECVPIRYVRTTAAGPMIIAGEQIIPKPTRMEVTDWFCPAIGMVMRQDVAEGDKVLHIETTAVEPLQAVPPQVP